MQHGSRIKPHKLVAKPKVLQHANNPPTALIAMIPDVVAASAVAENAAWEVAKPAEAKAGPTQHNVPETQVKKSEGKKRQSHWHSQQTQEKHCPSLSELQPPVL